MSELEHGSSSSLGGAQSPEEAAEALRLYGEQQHSHPDVLQNLEDGESDELNLTKFISAPFLLGK